MDPTDTWHPCTIRIARTAGWVLAALTAPLVSRRIGGFCRLLHGEENPAKPQWSWHCAIRMAPVSVESLGSSSRDGRRIESHRPGCIARSLRGASVCVGFLPHRRSRTAHADMPKQLSFMKGNLGRSRQGWVGKMAHSLKAARTWIGPGVRKVSLIYRSDHGL